MAPRVIGVVRDHGNLNHKGATGDRKCGQHTLPGTSQLHAVSSEDAHARRKPSSLGAHASELTEPNVRKRYRIDRTDANHRGRSGERQDVR